MTVSVSRSRNGRLMAETARKRRKDTLEEADGWRGHSQDSSTVEWKHARTRCDAGSLGLLDGPDLRLGPGSGRSKRGVVGDDGQQSCVEPDRRRSRSAPEEPVTGSDTALHRPDVE